MQANYTKLELMTFRIGGQLFGIDIESIKEINCHLKIVPAPLLDPSVLGVINLRGDVLAVIDLGATLSVPGRRRNVPVDKFIVLRSDEERLALAVEKLEDVVTVFIDEIQPLPSNFRSDRSSAYKGLVKTGSEVLLILDAVAISSPDSKVLA
jgi:purine-binding chemotaxis protein CheW